MSTSEPLRDQVLLVFNRSTSQWLKAQDFSVVICRTVGVQPFDLTMAEGTGFPRRTVSYFEQKNILCLDFVLEFRNQLLDKVEIEFLFSFTDTGCLGLHMSLSILGFLVFKNSPSLRKISVLAQLFG